MREPVRLVWMRKDNDGEAHGHVVARPPDGTVTIEVIVEGEPELTSFELGGPLRVPGWIDLNCSDEPIEITCAAPIDLSKPCGTGQDRGRQFNDYECPTCGRVHRLVAGTARHGSVACGWPIERAPR